MAGLFQVLWGQAGGTFKQAEALNGTDGEPLIVPIKSQAEQTENICTRPTAVDWNQDGHLDLVVGNFTGTFYLFTGEGKSRFNPKPGLVQSGTDRLKIAGAHSDPFVIDWDRDGDLDLLSGSSEGGVQWAENSAGPGKVPELKLFRTLIAPGPQKREGELLSENDLSSPMHSTRVWVDDLNHDGKLDVLVGDCVTLLSTAPGVSKAEFAKKHAQWQAKMQQASEGMEKAANEKQREEIQKRFRDVYEERIQFMREDRTGFVWLYLQK